MIVDVNVKCNGCDRKYPVEIEITERSQPGGYGLPWESEPGQGCGWQALHGFTCECGAIILPEWIDRQDDVNEQVQEIEASDGYCDD